MKVFLKHKPSLPLVNIVLSINIGSKDESRESSGYVHLLEHLILFSGTEAHKPTELSFELRRRGCYINAHTDHDLMTFEFSLPAPHSEFALLFLKEKIFNLNPTEDELNKEKQIITEEINQIMDSPQNRGTTLVFQHLFPNHPYETPLYGNLENINKASLNHLLTFYRRYFVAANCSLAVVGDFSIPDMESSMKRIFDSPEKSIPQIPRTPKAKSLSKNNEISIEMDLQHAFMIVGFIAPEFNHKDQFAFNILNHILGKGVNPLLGLAVRSRKRLAAGFSTRYIALKHGGVFLIYMRTDPQKLHLLKRETLKFLNKTNTFRYSQTDFLKKDQIQVTDYLQSAQNQIKLNSEESKEQGLSSAISFARFMLLNKDSKQYNYREEIDKVSSAELRKVASEYICGKHHVVIYIIPKKNEA
ncbi:MAG: insulinase family protein [Candidatus Aminicenantes bacterium]|nr:insulinase family protein [Candidatus Aminicenantes bacterium]